MVSKVFTFKLCKRNRGFVLLDLLLALAVSAMIAIVCSLGIVRLASAWQYLVTTIRLEEAGRHILGIIEKDLGYRALEVELDASGKSINMQTFWGNKKILIKNEGKTLYTYTTTSNGTGKNPLFLEYATIENWQVKRVNSQAVLLSFVLKLDGRTRGFSKLIPCYNSEVSVNG